MIKDTIEEYLTTKGGYGIGNPYNFDSKIAIDKDTFFNFIELTQQKKWKKYCSVYSDLAKENFINLFCNEVDSRGLLDVLRKGIKDRGIEFKVCYFKPETSINAETIKLYEQNILCCIKNFNYSPKNEDTVDIVLFLNGIPIVSIETSSEFKFDKNTVSKCKFNRENEDKIFEFRNRVLVHFALDCQQVYMTTFLNGNDTYFLPFNQGSNGAGNVGGRGNPHIENKYQTSYLWEEVLCKDKLIEILHKYMHLQKINNIEKNETLIFPRYHQLDVVTKLLDDVKRNGAGKNYLIQHSTGSGKSSSIAWLAHRLSGLHDFNDEKIFQSIIIISDRKVLDSQLQETIYQLDHVSGIVEYIDEKKHASDLKNAINLGKQIIITTLQKFPIIYDKVRANSRNFAVIIDEAHSRAEAAKKLKVALSNDDNSLDEDYDIIEQMNNSLENVSFFAFTATPKEKTLQLFGQKQIDGTFKPFHIYSMQQAIEEGFILDVLQNYTTFDMYYNIIKNLNNNLDNKVLKKFLKTEIILPLTIVQKTIIMVEHFKDITSKKINGKAKAMLVAPSRLHAIYYFFCFKDYIDKNNYKNINILVTFSGSVNYKGVEWTEEKLNKTKKFKPIKENQLKEQFHTDDFNILIAAQKYQTGFDEPLLHTMFIDKKLAGLTAVQTLSRLNRAIKGKTDTFILDFVNDVEDIRSSFEPYYKSNLLQKQTDINTVYQLKASLNKFQIYQSTEIEKFIQFLYSKNSQPNLICCLKPVLNKIQTNLSEEEKNEFYNILLSFIKSYYFIRQIGRIFNKDMHQFFLYSKFLLSCKDIDIEDKINLDSEIRQTYNELIFDGDIVIENKIKNTYKLKDESKETLASIIDKMNKRFGTSFVAQSGILEQIKNDFVKDDKMIYVAKSGDESLFKYLYEQKFKDIAANCYEKNNKFFASLFEDEAKMQYIVDSMKEIVFKELKNKKDNTD